ncbi:MAG: diguanylate cyclase [Methylohalobius sp. ZOD2]|nr:diguanylate cyclase [Methylothermaceae bacterium]
MAILIVDDDPQLGRLVGIRLAAAGYRTLTARSASQALACLGIEGEEKADPEIDLVMLDIFLPDAWGIDLCRRIKENPGTCDIPVIMITGSTDEEDLQRAFDVGAMDYIEKPFKGVELLARLRSALRLKAEIEQRKRQAQELIAVADQLKQANEQLRQLSFHDGLTGLHNRRYFDEFLEREFKRAQRTGSSLALIMIDIDHFKTYNDRFGHQAGDECLRRISASFNQVVNRANDLIARYGGEEFSVILPDTDQAGALAVAENLRRAVEALCIVHPDSPFGIVTISEGIVTHRPKPKDRLDALIEAADNALYHSKRSGRNRVSVAA